MAGHACKKRRAVRVTAAEQCSADMGEQPPIGRDPGLRGSSSGADEQGGGLVDRPLGRVPQVVGVGERTVAGPGRRDLVGSARRAERRVRVARPMSLKRPHSAAISSRCARLDVCSAAANVFSIEGVLLHHGHTRPAAISMGAMNSGGRVSTSSGGPSAASRSRRRPASPGPRLCRRHDHRDVALARCDGASAWLMSSCWDTPTSARRCSAPGAPMRRATPRPGSVSDHEPCG